MIITAAIPCYNAEPYLAEAIESVLAQSVPVEEIIVVDDASTDGSRDVARRFGVTLLALEQNTGQSAARNRALQSARGDVIAWLDADDLWEPDHIAAVSELLQRFPEADVAFSAVRKFGASTRAWRPKVCIERPESIFWASLERTIPPANCVLTRRDALLRHGGWDPSIRVAPDFDLWLRMSRDCLFVATRRITAAYRWHDAQIDKWEAQLESVYRARVKMYERLRAEGNTQLADEVAGFLGALWESQAGRAWQTRDMPLLTRHCSLADLLPQPPKSLMKYRLRTKLPRVAINAWERVRELLKRYTNLMVMRPDRS